MTKTVASLSGFLLAIGALLVAADKPITPLPPPGDMPITRAAAALTNPVAEIQRNAAGETRIPITYWATPPEFDAYIFLCQLARDAATNPVPLLVETTIYTPTNGFQVFMKNVFSQWVQGKAAHEHQQELADISQAMQNLSATELRMIKSMMQAVATNPPALPTGGQ